MKKTALALSIVLVVSACYISPVQAKNWNTVRVSTPDLCPYNPSITYNGSRITFNAEVNGLNQIFVVNSDGTGFKQLTDGSMDNRCPMISWDGSRIAFFSARKFSLGAGEPLYEDGKMFVVNSDGTGLTQIGNDIGLPQLSGDGRTIVYASSNDNQIYVVNSDGTGLEKLTNFTNSENISPSISGDGQKIAFTAEINNFQAIYVINSDGTGLKQITNNVSSWELLLHMPMISGDGSKITFESLEDGDFEIFVVNSDGTGLKKLTNNTDWDRWTSISGDGSKIAFVSKKHSDEGWYTVSEEFFVVNSDGTGLMPVDGYDKSYAYPVISGDGRHVVFVNSSGVFLSELAENLNPTPTLTSSPIPEPEPFLAALVIAVSGVLMTSVCVALLFYFKKRKY